MRKDSTTSRPAPWLADMLELDRGSDEPLFRQLYARLRDRILRGEIRKSVRLPSSRSLAATLGVSRNTVIAAYLQLEAEGYVDTRRGSQTIVVANPAPPTPASIPIGMTISRRGQRFMAHAMEHSFEGYGNRSLQPGIPDINYFPFRQWRQMLTKQLSPGRREVFGYNHVAGYPPLRRALAQYLASSRGVRCEPDQIVVTNGAQSAFDVLSRILLDPGDNVLMEEPGYPAAQSVFLGADANLLPLPVEEGGWRLDALPDAPIRAIYVTPSAHSPLGGTMRVEERLRLIEIANRQKAWIIEDDFDGEYRLEGPAVPSLQGIDQNSRTIYIGTLSKTMFPALRIGYMVLPRNAVAHIDRMIFLTGQFASLLNQAALADFIDAGYFTAHLGRMRRLYRKRRSQFAEICAAVLGEYLVPARTSAGIQSLWYCRDDISDTAVVRLARERGVVMTPLSVHYLHGRPRQGVILGYAALEPHEAERELRALVPIFEAVRRGG